MKCQVDNAAQLITKWNFLWPCFFSSCLHSRCPWSWSRAHSLISGNGGKWIHPPPPRASDLQGSLSTIIMNAELKINPLCKLKPAQISHSHKVLGRRLHQMEPINQALHYFYKHNNYINNYILSCLLFYRLLKEEGRSQGREPLWPWREQIQKAEGQVLKLGFSAGGRDRGK